MGLVETHHFWRGPHPHIPQQGSLDLGSTFVHLSESSLIGLISFPFFSTIVLSKNRIRSPWGSGGFLERRIPGKNGEGTSRIFKVDWAWVHFHAQ